GARGVAHAGVHQNGAGTSATSASAESGKRSWNVGAAAQDAHSAWRAGSGRCASSLRAYLSTADATVQTAASDATASATRVTVVFRGVAAAAGRNSSITNGAGRRFVARRSRVDWNVRSDAFEVAAVMTCSS